MIEYIVPGNIDDRVLARTARLLAGGALAAIPTDTSWSVVCSAGSRDGIKRLKSLPGARDERLFTLICSSVSQFADTCLLDNTRYRIIRRLTPGPYVFVLKTLHGTEKALGLRRGETGVRLPSHPVPQALVRALGNPLYGVTAKRSMLPPGGPLPESDEDLFFKEEELFEGGWEVEDIPGISVILDPGEDRERLFSTVLDLREDAVNVLREGAGPWPA